VHDHNVDWGLGRDPETRGWTTKDQEDDNKIPESVHEHFQNGKAFMAFVIRVS